MRSGKMIMMWLWMGIAVSHLIPPPERIPAARAPLYRILPDPPPASTAPPESKPDRNTPGDFCLRLLPGWAARPNGDAIRLVAPADVQGRAAAFRLDVDRLTLLPNESEAARGAALAKQAMTRLEASLRNVQEYVGARRTFVSPNGVGFAFRLQGTPRSGGNEAIPAVAYALISEDGKRTALLTSLARRPDQPSYTADLEAMLRALRFLRSAPPAPRKIEQFAGTLVPGENRFHLWLRDDGDAEAVWDTRSTRGEEISARFAGTYALVGGRLRVALLRTGGENRYASRLLELDIQTPGGMAQGTVRLDDVREMPIARLNLVSAKVLDTDSPKPAMPPPVTP